MAHGSLVYALPKGRDDMFLVRILLASASHNILWPSGLILTNVHGCIMWK